MTDIKVTGVAKGLHINDLAARDKLLSNKKFKVEFIPTISKVADIFTKNLRYPEFKKNRTHLVS